MTFFPGTTVKFTTDNLGPAVSLLTIADALTHYALAQESGDERIPRVIRALYELDYNETADVLRRIAAGRELHSVKS